MASVKDWRVVLAIIDQTFKHYESRLPQLREETLAFMRQKLEEASIPTHVTPAHTPEESRVPLRPAT